MPLPLPVLRLLVQSGLARWLPAVRRRLGESTRILPLVSDRLIVSPLGRLDDLNRRLAGLDSSIIDLSQLPSVITGARPVANRRVESDDGPRGLRRLREQLAGIAGLPASADQFLIAHGARGALQLVADAYLNPGERVVLLDPSSPGHIDLFRHRQARIRWVETRWDAGALTCEPERLRRALAGAKLMCLAQPGNPTGGYLGPATLDAIVRCAERYNVIAVIDRGLSQWEETSDRLKEVNERFRARLINIGRTSTPGIGWLECPAALLTPCLLAANSAAPVSVGLQHAALTQLLTDERSGEDCWLESRDYVCDRLSSLGLGVLTPVAGPFVWVDISALQMTGRRFADRLALESNVLVQAGERCGPSGYKHIRVSFAGDEGRLREGLCRITQFVQSLPKARNPSITSTSDNVGEVQAPMTAAA